MQQLGRQLVFVALLGSALSVDAAEVLKADLKACLHDGTNIGNVSSCGKVWKLKSGRAVLDSDGSLKVDVKGLVLNDESTGQFNGTPDGVDAVAAAVICQSASGAAVAAQAEPVLLSKSGDAKIHAKLDLPACTAPVIVLRERYEGKIGGWLAGTGY
ncbi:MAG: hypothetical protein K2X00_23035 [Nitrospiraceae bacterium]|jgi:hypothetical protein|nr:hypothetical protein [Nitrospiraceae bacterium]